MAAAVALDLVERREVGEQWLMPSVLPKMSASARPSFLPRYLCQCATCWCASPFNVMASLR